MQKTFHLLILTLLLSSCARTYHVVEPPMYNYENRKLLMEDIHVSYLYDAQNLNRNRPYARKERKKHLKLIPVKIENNSDTTITLTRDNFLIKSPTGRDIKVIDYTTYSTKVRQYAETFILFYGLAGIQYTWYQVNGESYSTFRYNPIPLLIGIGNAIMATVSNTKHRKSLVRNQIYNKPIPPGSNLYGLITIEEIGYPELNFFYYK